MRLICPNCDAEYEVDAAVIPAAGRDVQCSNCGHAWFQMSPEHEAELAAEDELYEAPAAPPAAAGPAPRGLDESVLAVLREEAAREANARRNDRAQPIETQTEMGLQSASSTPHYTDDEVMAGAAARRVARLKGFDPDAPRAVPARAPTRRELLPEIDEINSSLRAASEKRTGEPAAVALSMPVPARGRSGFRSGFALMVLLAVVAVAVYAMAARIVEQIPGSAGVMAGYVAAVDAVRLWLDAALKAAIAWMSGPSGRDG